MLVRVRRLLTIRARLADAGPSHQAGRALGRRVLCIARTAGRRRDRHLLDALDRVLSRLRAGVAAGAERELNEVLDQPSARALDDWLNRHPVRHPGLRSPDLEVLLAGIGPGQPHQTTSAQAGRGSRRPRQ